MNDIIEAGIEELIEKITFDFHDKGDDGECYFHPEKAEKWLRSFAQKVREGAIEERDQQILSWREIPIKGLKADGTGPIGCDKCGGALYKVRAKYPANMEEIMQGRLICPTCAIETLEHIYSNLYPNNQSARSLLEERKGV